VKYAVDDVKITTLELPDQFRNQVWPARWKVLLADIANGIAQLSTTGIPWLKIKFGGAKNNHKGI
jgi:hypothetical protein